MAEMKVATSESVADEVRRKSALEKASHGEALGDGTGRPEEGDSAKLIEFWP